MGKAFITDYISNPDVEIEVLSNLYTNKISNDVEVLMVWHQKIDDKYLSQFPNLKGIVRYGVGVDKINFEDAKKRKLVVCNTPDYATSEVSDTALSMILNITRGIKFYDLKCRTDLNTWKQNTTLKNIRRASEQTLGVIGAGRIGSAVIKKANAIGFKVLFYDPYKPTGYESEIQVTRFNDLYELVKKSDIISLHAPLTKETSNMVDEKFIEKMKDGASIINTSRGGLIKNLDILYNALITKKINCLGFDVLPEEPPSESDLIKAWQNQDELSSRIIINPHTSYYSVESFIESRSKTAMNAKRIIKGEKPINIIKDYRLDK